MALGGLGDDKSENLKTMESKTPESTVGNRYLKPWRITGRIIAGLLVIDLCVACEPVTGAATVESVARSIVSLDGEWAFALDPGNAGEKEEWWAAENAFAEKINVPGCWQGQGIGQSNGKLRHHYEGAAWYKKNVLIPGKWKGKTVWLTIGGAARYTKVFVNGKMVGEHDGFMTPFRFDISEAVNAGAENVIALRVDNSGGGPMGCFNYLGNWGGVYRPVTMEASDNVWIDDVFVIPDVDQNQARVKVTLGGREGVPPFRAKLKVKVSYVGKAKGETFVAEKKIDMKPPQELETEMVVSLSDVKLWSPETPNLYAAEVTLSGGGMQDGQNVRFGMRKIDWTGERLLVNGRPYFLRGYGDDNIEVITGLPPASKEFFRQRLKLTKSFGFNDVRFHSHAPLEECFQAADEEGMFIQAELPSVYIFYFLANKDLLRKELVRMLKAYRNHPSFFSLAMGNEFYLPALKDDEERQQFRDTVREFYDLAKTLDTTRPILSNDGEPELLPTDIHSGGISPLLAEWPGTPPGGRPYICHEYGMYQGSLPDLAANERLTGVIMPSAGMAAQTKWVQEHALGEVYPAVLKNSQLVLEIHRKHSLEKARLSGTIDGYNYWLITDFPGGVEGDMWAYGVLDQFWQPGKQATPENVSKVNSPTVLLLEAGLGGRCLRADQPGTFRIMVSHFGSSPIHKGTLVWRLMSGAKALAHGQQAGISAEVGDTKQIATVELDGLPLERAELLELVVELRKPFGSHVNSWPIWAFPHVSMSMKETIACQPQLAGSLAAYDFIKPFDPAKLPDLLIAAELDRDVEQYVLAGGKLILLAKNDSLAGQASFPLFNYGDTQGAGSGTVIERGGLMDAFPHRGFCEEQFLNLMQMGTGIDMDVLPQGLRPEIWGIRAKREQPGTYNVFLTRRAMLFTGRLGKGKVLVCTFDLPKAVSDKHPEADYLLRLLLEQAQSEPFEPKVELERNLFLSVKPAS